MIFAFNLPFFAYPSKAQAASQTWTSQSDWESGSRSNVDTTSSGGNLKLSSSSSGSQTIAFRAASTTGDQANSTTISKPTGVVDNDVMIAALTYFGDATLSDTVPTITPPSGWTLVRRTTNTAEGHIGLAIYYKVASSEGSSYTWTLSTGSAVIGIQAYSGVDTSNPIDAENGQATDAGAGTSHSTPSITTSVANTMLVTNFTAAAEDTWTTPSGETRRFRAYWIPNIGHSASAQGNDETKSSAGATGTKTATIAVIGAKGVTHILALKPGGTITYSTPGTDTIQYNSGSSGTTWSALSWTGSTPASTTIKARARASETQSGLGSATWSSYVTTSGGSISLTGQWVDVEWNLSTSDTSTTSTLNDGTITYTTSSGSSSSGGSTSTPTPTPSSGSTSSSSGGSTTTTIATTTTSGSGGGTTVITKVAKDACTSEFTELTLAATDTRANLKFKSLNSDLATWYIYENKRATKSGTPPVGYDKDSLFVRDRVATKDHDLTKDGLKAQTTYYYAIEATVKGKKVVSCEYSFTTVATAVSATNALTGNIYEDGTKNPLVKVKVILLKKLDTGLFQKVKDVDTDSAGAFNFDYEPGNEYYITYTKPDGYFYGLTLADSSCPSRTRSTNVVYFDQKVLLPATGCRVVFYARKILDSDPTVSGKVLKDGTSEGYANINLNIYENIGGVNAYLGSIRSNDLGKWQIKVPSGVPLSISATANTSYLFGKTKVKFGCPGDLDSTYSFRWIKNLIPAAGCANNTMFLTPITPPDPLISGTVFDTAKAGVSDIRMDLLTFDGSAYQLASRVYTDQAGKWQFKAKSDTAYWVTVNFDLSRQNGYFSGPALATSDCPTANVTASVLAFNSIPPSGCVSNTFTATSLTGSNSLKITGSTLSDGTHESVAGIPVTLARYDASKASEAVWQQIAKVYSDPDGRFEFQLVKGEKYYINTGVIPGYLFGFSQPTTNCLTKDIRYPQRLTFVKQLLIADCQMSFYLTKADGKISGVNYVTGSATGLDRTYMSLYKSLARSITVLTYGYAVKSGAFSLDCRTGVTDYKLRANPNGQTIQNLKLELDGPTGKRTLDPVKRTDYIALQTDECREPQPLDLKVMISPAGGTFEGSVDAVSLSYTSTDPTHKAQIYYTIDGNQPTANSNLYRRLIKISRLQNTTGTQTVQLRAVAIGSASTVAQATFILNPLAVPSPTPTTAASPAPISSPTPNTNITVTANPKGGAQTEPVSVTLTSIPSSPDIAIFYTTDGADPITSGKEYIAPITLNTTTNLTFYAKNKTNSDVSSIVHEQYSFANPIVTQVDWQPQPGTNPIYTINCNGEPIGTTRQPTFIDPTRQLDGCVYTVKTVEGEVKGINIKALSTSQPLNFVTPSLATLTTTAGAALVALTVQPDLPVKVVEGVGAIPFLLQTLWLHLLAFLGIRKRRNPWGTIYNSVNEQPLAGAIVSLYLIVGGKAKLIEQQLSDQAGRYGFLITPGQYQIKVAKTGYTFPSIVFSKTYTGTPFVIKNQQTVNLDLFLDPAGAIRHSLVNTRRVGLFVNRLHLPLLLLGSTVVGYDLVKSITTFGLAMAAVYLILWINELISLGRGREVLRLVDETGRPLPFTLFCLTDVATKKVSKLQVTDARGEAYVLLPSGEYNLTLATPRHSQGISQTVKIPRSVILNSLTVKIPY